MKNETLISILNSLFIYFSLHELFFRNSKHTKKTYKKKLNCVCLTLRAERVSMKNSGVECVKRNFVMRGNIPPWRWISDFRGRRREHEVRVCKAGSNIKEVKIFSAVTCAQISRKNFHFHAWFEKFSHKNKLEFVHLERRHW